MTNGFDSKTAGWFITGVVWDALFGKSTGAPAIVRSFTLLTSEDISAVADSPRLCGVGFPAPAKYWKLVAGKRNMWFPYGPRAMTAWVSTMLRKRSKGSGGCFPNYPSIVATYATFPTKTGVSRPISL